MIISDACDNPTAGAAGDVPAMLARLLALEAKNTLVASFPDPLSVALCRQAGVGAELELVLGGKLDPVHGMPLPIRGCVESICTIPWSIGTSSRS